MRALLLLLLESTSALIRERYSAPTTLSPNGVMHYSSGAAFFHIGQPHEVRRMVHNSISSIASLEKPKIPDGPKRAPVIERQPLKLGSNMLLTVLSKKAESPEKVTVEKAPLWVEHLPTHSKFKFTIQNLGQSKQVLQDFSKGSNDGKSHVTSSIAVEATSAKSMLKKEAEVIADRIIKQELNRAKVAKFGKSASGKQEGNESGRNAEGVPTVLQLEQSGYSGDIKPLQDLSANNNVVEEFPSGYDGLSALPVQHASIANTALNNHKDEPPDHTASTVYPPRHLPTAVVYTGIPSRKTRLTASQQGGSTSTDVPNALVNISSFSYPAPHEIPSYPVSPVPRSMPYAIPKSIDGSVIGRTEKNGCIPCTNREPSSSDAAIASKMLPSSISHSTAPITSTVSPDTTIHKEESNGLLTTSAPILPLPSRPCNSSSHGISAVEVAPAIMPTISQQEHSPESPVPFAPFSPALAPTLLSAASLPPLASTSSPVPVLSQLPMDVANSNQDETQTGYSVGDAAPPVPVSSLTFASSVNSTRDKSTVRQEPSVSGALHFGSFEKLPAPHVSTPASSLYPSQSPTVLTDSSKSTLEAKISSSSSNLGNEGSLTTGSRIEQKHYNTATNYVLSTTSTSTASYQSSSATSNTQTSLQHSLGFIVPSSVTSTSAPLPIQEVTAALKISRFPATSSVPPSSPVSYLQSTSASTVYVEEKQDNDLGEGPASQDTYSPDGGKLPITPLTEAHSSYGEDRPLKTENLHIFAPMSAAFHGNGGAVSTSQDINFVGPSEITSSQESSENLSHGLYQNTNTMKMVDSQAPQLPVSPITFASTAGPHYINALPSQNTRDKSDDGIPQRTSYTAETFPSLSQDFEPHQTSLNKVDESNYSNLEEDHAEQSGPITIINTQKSSANQLENPQTSKGSYHRPEIQVQPSSYTIHSRPIQPYAPQRLPPQLMEHHQESIHQPEVPPIAELQSFPSFPLSQQQSAPLVVPQTQMIPFPQSYQQQAPPMLQSRENYQGLYTQQECCGGQIIDSRGALCMPMNFGPCRNPQLSDSTQLQPRFSQENGCGTCSPNCASACHPRAPGCGSGSCCEMRSPACCQGMNSLCCNHVVQTCCQPQLQGCCNLKDQSCCPSPLQSCCCSRSQSLGLCRRAKRSIGGLLGLCGSRNR